MEVRRQKTDLDSFLKDIHKIINELQSTDGKQYDANDARKVILLGLQNELQFYSLSIRLSKKLLNDDFYKNENLKVPQKNDDFQTILDSHLHSTSLSFLLLIATHFENYLRLVASSRGLEKYSISDTFKEFKTPLGLSDEDENCFKVLFNIRNSFHNGGFFGYPDITLKISEIEFKFVKNEIVSFPNNMSFMDNNLFIIKNLVPIVNKINLTTKSWGAVEHNYSKIKFLDEL